MRFALAAPLLLAGAAARPLTRRGAPSATMVFNQSEAASIYDAVGTTVKAGVPYFAVADGLNAPYFAEVYNGATGALAWSFANGTGTYLLDVARHAESAGLPVDTFVAIVSGTGTTDNTMLYGFQASGSGTPAWQTALPGCTTDGGGGTYTGMQASDDGSTLAFLCHVTTTQPATARAYSVNGQTGAVNWMYDLGTNVQAGQGQIQVTASGSYVLFVNEGGKPTPNTADAYILTASGTLRDHITIPFFITAAISDSGDYVVVGDDPAVHVWKWAGTAYAPAYDLQPPVNASAPQSWIPWDMTMSTGSDATEMLVVGYISGDVLSVQVSAWRVATQALVTNYVTAKNPKLQENPTLRADGDYIGVSLWGDAGELPTVALLKAGSNATLFTYVSPGSMMAVDLAVIPAAAAGGADTVLLAAAGKAVPANVMGNGGSAYGFSVSVPT